MAGILEFDTKHIRKKIDALGIKNAWMQILVDAIGVDDRFLYILKHENFNNIERTGVNLIQNLSIGEIGVLYEYSLAYSSANNRKANGQFFTPDDVAKLMAGHSRKFPEGVWLDPCSGVGNLSWHLVDLQKNKEEFAKKHIILLDKDPLALFIARVLFAISFQEKDENLFNSIENNFIEFDFLSVSDNGQMSVLSGAGLEKIPEHDYVIVNPPYLATSQEKRFETYKCADLYAYFLENIIKTSSGFISVTPQSFTNALKFKPLRGLLVKNFSELSIYSFDNVPDNIFHGVKFGSSNTNTANSIRPSITIARKTNKKEHRVTSLLRWKRPERSKMLENLDLFLSNVDLEIEYFPKVNQFFLDVYNNVTGLNTLESIIAKKKTQYPLYIPSSPRYFIPALKNKVNRSSQRVLYFKSEEERNIAYMLINSSFMYWWWRVRDGGMTLSLETLKSLPLLNFKINNKIISCLEKSENVNKVYKINAGKTQENVKHDKNLITSLNKHILGDRWVDFMIIHTNSDLDQAAHNNLL